MPNQGDPVSRRTILKTSGLSLAALSGITGSASATSANHSQSIGSVTKYGPYQAKKIKMDPNELPQNVSRVAPRAPRKPIPISHPIAHGQPPKSNVQKFHTEMTD